jgi:hypothetical protein
MKMLVKLSALVIVGVSGIALAAPTPTPTHIGEITGQIRNLQSVSVQTQGSGTGGEVSAVTASGIDFTWPNLVSPDASMTVAYARGPHNIVCKLFLSKPLLKDKTIKIEVASDGKDGTAFCRAAGPYTKKLVEQEYLTINNMMGVS